MKVFKRVFVWKMLLKVTQSMMSHENTCQC